MNDFERYPEIVLGLVAPLGINIQSIEDYLIDALKYFNYQLIAKKLSESIKEISGVLNVELKNEPEDARIDSFMTAGNKAREHFGKNYILAAIAVAGIHKSRKEGYPAPSISKIIDTLDSKIGRKNVTAIKELAIEKRPTPKTVYLFNSLKHPDEVQLLRNIYGEGFFLLGINSSREKRLRYLMNRKHISQDEAERLIARDESESHKTGQHVREAFHLSDFFIDIDADDDFKQIRRVLDLIFSNPYITPTKEEYAMFLAFASSLRSADLSRQIGAVITSSEGEVIATGANDVPKPGGGLYWPGGDDMRDHIKGFDSNTKRRNEIVIAILEKIFPKKDRSELLEHGKKTLYDTGIYDITEYGRAVHGEMEALISCARSGVSPRGGTIFGTTYPCHNCAKHIIASGIKRVVFVEPYPKSHAKTLHSDEIVHKHEDGQTEDNKHKVMFEPFVGVGPRRFIDLFSMNLGSGKKLQRNENGNIIDVDKRKHSVRVPMLPLSYINRENNLLGELKEIMEKKNEEKDRME